MSALRTTYKVLRSLLFTVIMIAVTVYVGLYVVLSIPSVQKAVKGRVEKEASSFIGSKVEIGSLKIFPFNEIRLSDVKIFTPKDEKCISVGTLGAGIHLWRLVYDREIEITYAEIIGLDGKVWKETPESPMNIDFIIRAFAPKEKNKPPKEFDLKLHNVVIRKSRLSYDILDAPHKNDPSMFDMNHISLDDFKADIALPILKNEDIVVDLRRLSFRERCGLSVGKLGMTAHITPNSLDVKNLSLRLPGSDLRISDIHLQFESFKEIMKALDSGNHLIQISASRLSPSDFKCFYAPLGTFYGEYKFDAGISGRTDDIYIEQFLLRNDINDFNLKLRCRLQGMPEITNITGKLEDFELVSSPENTDAFLRLLPGLKKNVSDIVDRIGNINLKAKGSISMPECRSEIIAEITSGIGDVQADGGIIWKSSKAYDVYGDVDSRDLDLGKLIENNKFGTLSFTSSVDMSVQGKEIDASADVVLSNLEFNGESISNMSFSGEKRGDSIIGLLAVDDESISLESHAEIVLDKENSQWNIDTDIHHFIPSRYDILPKYRGYSFAADIVADLRGNSIDNMVGDVNVNSLTFEKAGEKGLHLSSLSLTSQCIDSIKSYAVSSDFINGKLEGSFTFGNIVKFSKDIAVRSVPSLVAGDTIATGSDFARLNLAISPNDEFAEFFSLPVKPYSEVRINGDIKSAVGTVALDINAPYLVKGNKMIRGTRVNLKGDRSGGIKGDISGTIPAKNDDANLHVVLSALSDNISADIDWTFVKNKTAEGNIALEAFVSKNPLTGKPDINVQVSPSSFRLNGSEWRIDRARAAYSGDAVDVDNLRIWHAGQFLTVNGRASSSSLDALKIKLAGIDLSYIFEALNINYVNFGGIATGEVLASDLFTRMPVLRTERLFVKDLSYNGAVLGDGNLESHWVNESKKVAINADIRKGRRRVALIGGGIFVTRDSLSFDMLADHVNIEFLKPFMSAFTSDVGGEASGRVKLYGTFKDIDLKGKVLADSIRMKVDYTNVYYHGTDSVDIRPGYIDIPSFRLYDKYGNSAVLKGFVKHRYFHDPEFEFRLTDARNLLCFDTNNKINPDWYGKIFAYGGGVLRGRPGIVSMMLDVSTSASSDFTFVLSETQTAADYEFLTFSDRKKERQKSVQGTIDLEEKFKNALPKVNDDRPSLFSMDIRCSVTPATRLTLVMDPKAGDKITARGEGPMQISYDTDTDEMQIYGKYTLAEGNYNFSLQDLILRDFKINAGSNISFNGDPMQGVLDITAAYRVNTNLSDLDKSFSTDRDLNRTNVPVDALLKVSGDMRSPGISFDIALPTLTQDVERKVKSIISTDDMMNRQIIYLLALNRFYTPEYMGSTSNGSGELASVASSTLSSQLSSFMGQLTDKVTLAPSFRSDKGDFSDMEVDVALSSRLLDNRLLINGNFGYRDRSTSQSTFVGDFDIEYLLNRNGNLRLKAYNHFNDQNYYLRSALTTQGIGVIYRRDFDNPFTFLKRKKKKNRQNEEMKEDTPGIMKEDKNNNQ